MESPMAQSDLTLSDLDRSKSRLLNVDIEWGSMCRLQI